MPDAARKWLEKFDKIMAYTRKHNELLAWLQPKSLGDVAEHLRRLLEQNERLRKRIAVRLDLDEEGELSFAIRELKTHEEQLEANNAELKGQLALEDRNIPTLGARINQLEADNKRLYDEQKILAQKQDRLDKKNIRLDQENAALRERHERDKAKWEIQAKVWWKKIVASQKQAERLPGIKIADGTVWLVFPGATISIDAIGARRGPIVGKNLRTWRDKILKGADMLNDKDKKALQCVTSSHTDKEYEELQQRFNKLKLLTVERIREYIQGMAREVEVWGLDVVGWLIDEHAALQQQVERLREALFGEYCDCGIKSATIRTGTHTHMCKYFKVMNRILSQKEQSNEIEALKGEDVTVKTIPLDMKPSDEGGFAQKTQKRK
ncbi:hypothetical protein LCGC14_1671600 [marine sediment metagenome]|uniref:Uncharacterized protein n=1 Tax=marine sediment metagenome TaxID=412755 RepID=A0A0F9HR74_9ZZZZ